LPYKPDAPHPVASAPQKHGCAFVFSAYGRKFKPPSPRVVVDLNNTPQSQIFFTLKTTSGSTQFLTGAHKSIFAVACATIK
jgi:hypothetical protein